MITPSGETKRKKYCNFDVEYRGFESIFLAPLTPLHYTSVTWVVPPKTALGVALMDKSGGHYNGNEIEEWRYAGGQQKP